MCKEKLIFSLGGMEAFWLSHVVRFELDDGYSDDLYIWDDLWIWIKVKDEPKKIPIYIVSEENQKCAEDVFVKAMECIIQCEGRIVTPDILDKYINES